jgi:hypothetical protein
MTDRRMMSQTGTAAPPARGSAPSEMGVDGAGALIDEETIVEVKLAR